MLEKLRIQNFKCWEDTGEIDMAPITLFFGTNSSGKSSIGQFLMILKQTIEDYSQKAVFYLGGKDSEVQLNSYNEMVFQNDLKNNNIIFKYHWSLNDASDFKILNPPYTALSGNRLVFQAKVDFPDLDPEEKSPPIPSISEFKYKLKKDRETQFSSGMERERAIDPSGRKTWDYVVNATSTSKPKFELKGKSSRQSEDGIRSIRERPIKFHHFPRDVTDIIYSNAEDFSTKFHSEHKKLFGSLFYLGPIRTNEPQYNYIDAPPSVGSDGEHTIGAIVAAKDRDYEIVSFTETGKREISRHQFEKLIAFNLKEIGLIEEFKVKNIYRQIYEVTVKTKGSQTWVNLSNVGFGVSQVLPLLVQCFYAPEGSIILIDQPEVHLHPYAQSALADVMIGVIESKLKSGEEFKERNIQLIIETHSEHFLRRLQRRIAEGLSKDKIAAYSSSINDDVPLDRLADEKKLSQSELAAFENAGISSAKDLATCPEEELIAAYFANEVSLARLAKEKNLPTTELAAFENAGISSAKDLATRSEEELCKVPNIGPAKANKWQKAAKEGVDKWQEAALEYVGPGKEKAQLERLKIDEYGNIQNWPENFFGDEMGDITAQAKAAMEKRMQPHTTNVEKNK